ncbi:MAG: hypothetical protein ACLSUW_03560 [Akkermansia sp.]
MYALATSSWETPLGTAAFFMKTMARQALTRMAHAAAERPDEVDSVLDHLLPNAAERVSLADQFPRAGRRIHHAHSSSPDGLKTSAAW